MLVLSRKKNESIVINNDITVTVVEIREDRVRLGIVVPREIPVHRQEVFDAIHGRPVPPSSPVEYAKSEAESAAPPTPGAGTMPEAARAILNEYERQIGILDREMEAALAKNDFISLACQRELIGKLTQSKETLKLFFQS